MPTLQSIMAELRSKGSEKTRSIYARHGIPADRTFGVSVADLKVIAKTIKGQQALACQLYETGNMDAMYLAGVVADGSKMNTYSMLDLGSSTSLTAAAANCLTLRAPCEPAPQGKRAFAETPRRHQGRPDTKRRCPRSRRCKAL